MMRIIIATIRNHERFSVKQYLYQKERCLTLLVQHDVFTTDFFNDVNKDLFDTCNGRLISAKPYQCLRFTNKTSKGEVNND